MIGASPRGGEGSRIVSFTQIDSTQKAPYLEGSSSDELIRFSTARMTPSFVHTPTAVEPSCGDHNGQGACMRRAMNMNDPTITTLSDPEDKIYNPRFPPATIIIPAHALTLMASMAYSTWKRRPSGEKVLTPRSYSLLHWEGWCVD